MADLVERLKFSPLWSPHKELLEEAAAEIKRLRAEVELLSVRREIHEKFGPDFKRLADG